MKRDEVNALFNTSIDGQSNSHCEICKYKQTLEEIKRKIIKIFACLIKANRANKILDTLWIDDITTLWDYIALTLGIDGDQTQIEEQVLQNERGAK